jgi:hypothetical protein
MFAELFGDAPAGHACNPRIPFALKLVVRRSPNSQSELSEARRGMVIPPLRGRFETVFMDIVSRNMHMSFSGIPVVSPIGSRRRVP